MGKKAILMAAIATFALLSPASTAQDNSEPQPGPVPDAVGRMLSAASTDPDRFRSVLETALAAWPDEKGRILALARPLAPEGFDFSAYADMPEQQEAVPAEAAAPVERGFFAGWDVEGEASLGLSVTSGNTEEQAFAAGFSMDAKPGEDWLHHVDFTADFARRSGETTKERYLGNYELSYFIWENGYVYGLFNGEHDAFSGFSYRLSESVGLGYQVIGTEATEWSLEGGPGVRQTKPVDGDMEHEILFVANSDFSHNFTQNLLATNRTTVFAGSDRTTIRNIIAFETEVLSALTARLSFEVKHDTNVPEGREKTDTLSKVTLVYPF